MLPSVVEQFTAVLSSRRFTRFFDGADFLLPDGTRTRIKIESYSKPIRAEGYRFAKFSFITKTLTDQGEEGFGFGEGENQLLTFQKSIAESVERAVYLTLKPRLGLTSSNGWAAHLNEVKANRSALTELVERDAILAHWLTEKPFLEIDPATFPEWLVSWRDHELSLAPDFKNLRLLLSTIGHVPVVQAVIQNAEGFAFISHGAARSIADAIYRALAEVCRIASSTVQNPGSATDAMLDSPTSPWGHALFYAKNQRLPTWVFGKTTAFAEAKKIFDRQSFDPATIEPKFTSYRCGGLTISRCESEKVQNLFWGRGDEALSKGLIDQPGIFVPPIMFDLSPSRLGS